MSSTLRIEFAPDMPVAAVEVVTPDLRVVARAMVSPGRSLDVDVPTERSFLRVHLPDGRVVTLDDPGTPTRVISRSSLESASRAGLKGVGELDVSAPRRSITPEGLVPGVDDLASLALEAEASPPERVRKIRGPVSGRPRNSPKVVGDQPLILRDRGTVRLSGAPDAVGLSLRDGTQLRWIVETPSTSPPLALRYAAEDSAAIVVTLPASTVAVRVSHGPKRTADRGLRVGLRTRAEHADAILSYLSLGDLYAAQALTEWTDEAEAMVYRDDSDPYSGLVGAYLLLRLRQFDRMRDWVHQIADRFPFLPDGCVIWAWQQIHMSRGSTSQARSYLLEACDRGLPVYSEGLRLLLDGLLVLGQAGQQAHERMMRMAANVVWGSPLVTRFENGPHASPPKPLALEVSFAD